MRGREIGAQVSANQVAHHREVAARRFAFDAAQFVGIEGNGDCAKRGTDLLYRRVERLAIIAGLCLAGAAPEHGAAIAQLAADEVSGDRDDPRSSRRAGHRRFGA